jgi:DNA/RNA-binding protein KIN17
MGDFLQLLRTTHGEKRVNANHFYASQYIVKKDHIHMNSTRWKTLTEFVTFLGYEGICRVENTEKGWFISWIDNSPEALKKRDANLKRERLEKGEADREDRLIQEQIERAKQQSLEKQLATAEAHMMTDSQVLIAAEDNTRSNVLNNRGTSMEDVVLSSPPSPAEEPKQAAPLTITLQKPIITAPQHKKPSNNPLKAKRLDNPLKSAMKKDTGAKMLETVINDNGKRPLPKAVEIRDNKMQRKRMCGDQHDDDRTHRERDNHRDRDY